jgi:hypothetical protein
MEELVKAQPFLTSRFSHSPGHAILKEQKSIRDSTFRPAFVDFVYRVVEDNNAALLQKLAQRAIWTEEVKRIELSSASPDRGF